METFVSNAEYNIQDNIYRIISDKLTEIKDTSKRMAFPEDNAEAKCYISMCKVSLRKPCSSI